MTWSPLCTLRCQSYRSQERLWKDEERCSSSSEFYGLLRHFERCTNPTVNPTLLHYNIVPWTLTHTNTNTPRNTHLLYGLVNSPEGRLFVIVVNPSVPMQDVDALFLSWRTIAAIDTMIWTIIPLAGKLQQALWGQRKTLFRQKWASWCTCILTIMHMEWSVCVYKWTALPGLWWKMILRRSWSPQVMLSLYFWSRGMSSSSQWSPTDVMSFCRDGHVNTNVQFFIRHETTVGERGHPVACEGTALPRDYLEEHAPHPCHVHEHDSWVDSRPAVERMTGKAAVPGDAGLLVFRGHCSQLGGIKLGQEGPQVVYGLQEEDVWVHVHNWIYVL